MRAWLIAALATLGLIGCRPAPLQEQQAFVFGTKVEVIVADANPDLARRAIASVLQEFDRLHRTYHAWQPSALSALNTALANGQSATITPEMADLLRQSQAISTESKGLFDPGIGALIRLWGFQSDEFLAEPPPNRAIQTILASHPGIADLQIEGNQVRSRNRRVAVDFGGYLKGIALDRAARLLKAQGIHNALINIGGNVMALGDKGGRKWRIGIQHPRQPGPIATLDLNDGEAIGTSGDYQRYFDYQGRRYSHLIDPRVGLPADHTQAVTLLIPAGPDAGMMSDAYSKPIFIAGPKDWPAMSRQLGISYVLRVDRDGRVAVTAALNARLQFVDRPVNLEILP